MRNPQHIHNTPGLLRLVGLVFLLVGLGVITLLLIAAALGNWNGLFQFCFGLGLGVAFAFAGWAVFADDYLVLDTWSREAVFYKRQLFRSVEEARIQLPDQALLSVHPDPNNERCYRLMLGKQLVRERMSKRQIERLKDRLETALGLSPAPTL
ncbi:MAG: hypothetical protein ACE37H_07440 [Phycisphaeraceae bacterium]